ncbi:MAG: 4'-phosphopantetheinyl transferase superfamily protein [Acidobacteria bacterium]|nr:4'-phosphopantetheinyl transferase superfamily protein [Acidobacteriota bacterium]
MWLDAPSSLSLSSGEVHVWRVSLEQPLEVQQGFLRTLDADEQTRASRFHFKKHRRRFIAGRGVLRSLLGRYLEVKPEEVRFAYGPYGKPALDAAHHAGALRFNASHSHELAVYAFAQDHDVGIDVEYIKEDFATQDIAERFFSKYEVQVLTALPREEQAAGFFRCWTRKEAYIKAIGSGLSHPLDQFDVTLAPNEPAALLRDHRDPEVATRYAMFNLDLPAGYVGALAVAGSGDRLVQFVAEQPFA